MITILFLTGQIIVSSHPPLSPAEAADVLRARHGVSDVSDGGVVLGPEQPRVFTAETWRSRRLATDASIAQPPAYLIDMWMFNAAARRTERNLWWAARRHESHRRVDAIGFPAARSTRQPTTSRSRNP